MLAHFAIVAMALAVSHAGFAPIAHGSPALVGGHAAHAVDYYVSIARSKVSV